MKMTKAKVEHWNNKKEPKAPYQMDLHDCDHLEIETDTEGVKIVLQTRHLDGEELISVMVDDKRTEFSPHLFSASGKFNLNPAKSTLEGENPFGLFETKEGWEDANTALITNLKNWLRWAEDTYHKGGTADNMTSLAIRVRTEMEKIMRTEPFFSFGATDTEPHEMLVSIINAELGTGIDRWCE